MSVNHTHTTDTECEHCERPSTIQSKVDPIAPDAAASISPQAESSTSAQKPVAIIGDIRPPEKVVPAITIEFCDRCRW
jgi:hypothetical protein